MGLRLRDWGSAEFAIRDLWAIVRTSPPGSAIYRALYPEDADWGLQEHLLAVLADGVHTLLWQNGGDAKAKRPARIPRPGVEDSEREKKTYSGEAESLDDIRDWLGWGVEED